MSDTSWSETDIAWLAGLLEGEGCFSTPAHRGPFVTVKMTDRDIIDRVAVLWGGVSVFKYGSKKEQHKDGYECTLVDKTLLYKFCLAILPYMGIRRKKKIEGIIAILKRRFEAEANYKQKILFCQFLYRAGGFTKADLGRLSGLSPASIGRWISKGMTPRVSLVGYVWQEI